MRQQKRSAPAPEASPGAMMDERWLHRVHCCFSQNDSSPCDADPPITQGMPTATCPSAAAETQPSATAPVCSRSFELIVESLARKHSLVDQ
jgi:hypothetical protein